MLRGFGVLQPRVLFKYSQRFSVTKRNPTQQLFLISSVPCYTPVSAHFEGREYTRHAAIFTVIDLKAVSSPNILAGL